MFDRDRHEPLLPLEWSELAARETIRAIVHETHEQFARGFWPLHPRDAEPGDDVTKPMFSFYFGAAGTIWALRYLQEVGAVARADDYAAHLGSVLTANAQWLVASGFGNESASYPTLDTFWAPSR